MPRGNKKITEKKDKTKKTTIIIDDVDLVVEAEKRASAYEKILALEQKNKRLITGIGVALIMIVVVVFWIMNLRKNLGQADLKIIDDKYKINLERAREEMNKSMDVIKKNFERIEQENLTKDSKDNSSAIDSNNFLPKIITSESNILK